MKHTAARIRLWLPSRAHRHDPAAFALHAIGIRHRQPDVVRRAGLEIEHASREHVGRDQIDPRLGVDALALQPQQRQRGLPRRLALLAEGDVDGRIAIRVALNEPLEAEIDERRRIDHELPRDHAVRRDLCRRRGGSLTERGRGQQKQTHTG